jgi:ArsR family transcriptional regulator, arsenate/arsenite/antimonite-responsive transcriptional repressor
MIDSMALEVTASRPDQTEAAALLAAVADANRLALLTILAAGTTCVCDLQAQVPIAPNLLSYHLKVLRDAGLIAGARRGRWIDYSLAEGALERLHAAIPAPPAATAGQIPGGDGQVMDPGRVR